MALNIRIIQSELSRDGYTFITLPIYGVGTEIPLVLVLLFAAIANSGILEGLLFIYAKLIEGKLKTTRSKAWKRLLLFLPLGSWFVLWIILDQDSLMLPGERLNTTELILYASQGKSL